MVTPRATGTTSRPARVRRSSSPVNATQPTLDVHCVVPRSWPAPVSGSRRTADCQTTPGAIAVRPARSLGDMSPRCALRSDDTRSTCWPDSVATTRTIRFFPAGRIVQRAGPAMSTRMSLTRSPSDARRPAGSCASRRCETAPARVDEDARNAALPAADRRHRHASPNAPARAARRAAPVLPARRVGGRIGRGSRRRSAGRALAHVGRESRRGDISRLELLDFRGGRSVSSVKYIHSTSSLPRNPRRACRTSPPAAR